MTKQDKELVLQHLEHVATMLGAAKLEGDAEQETYWQTGFDTLCDLAQDLYIVKNANGRKDILARGMENAKMAGGLNGIRNSEADAVPDPGYRDIDYDKQKAAFKQIASIHSLHKTDVAVYTVLLDLCEKRHWPEWVCIPNGRLSRKARVSAGMEISAKKRLKDLGLIDFYYDVEEHKFTGTGYKLFKLYA